MLVRGRILHRLGVSSGPGVWFLGYGRLLGDLCVTGGIPPEHVALLYGVFARITYREEQKLRRYLDQDLLRALWVHHVRRFLEEPNDWSELQRRLLEEALTGLVSADVGSEPLQVSEDFKRRATHAFGPAEVYAIFYSLSGVAPAER